MVGGRPDGINGSSGALVGGVESVNERLEEPYTDRKKEKD